MLEKKLLNKVSSLLTQLYAPLPTIPFESGYLHFILSYVREYSELLFTLHLLKKYYGYDYRINRGIASIVNGILAEEVVLYKDNKIKVIRYKDSNSRLFKFYAVDHPPIEVLFPYAKKLEPYKYEVVIPLKEYDDLFDSLFYVPHGLVYVEEDDKVIKMKIDTALY